MQIFHAFGAIIGGLSRRVTNTFEDRSRWNGGRDRDKFRQEGGLIEAALAFARGMKRHRHDEIEVAAVETRVRETFHEPVRDGITEVALPAVFELVENIANETAAAVSGDGTIEMERAMLAVRATEGLGDCARERLGTFRAERRHDARCATATTGAQIFGV